MKGPPNLLLLLSDQHRHDWITSTAELPIRTPNLDRLRSSGLTFTRAYTPAPLCAPARACLATGRDYDTGPVPNNMKDLPAGSDTYYRALRDHAGYFVAGVGKFDLHKASLDWNPDGSRLLEEWGFSEGIDNEGKFDSLSSGRDGPRGPYMAHLREAGLDRVHIEDFEQRRHAPYADTDPSPLPEESYLDNWIAANGHRMLDRRPTGMPWHLVVNFAGPHDPMDVTERMLRDWDGVAFPPPYPSRAFEGDHQKVRRRYAAMIENIDQHVGTFLDRLETEGELENTVVIYTSDHGEMLGDHGVWGKQVPLDASVRIPLVISVPGLADSGSSTDALVSLEDLAATLLELAGVRVPGGMTARSICPVLDGSTDEHRSHVISGLDREPREIAAARSHYGDNQWVQLQRWRTVITATEKLIVSEDLPGPYLVDLNSDPHEEQNLAADRPESVQRLTDLLSDRRSRKFTEAS